MRTLVQHRRDFLIASALAALPPDFPLLPDEVLRDEVMRRAHPRPLASEIDDAIRYQELNRRIHGQRTETGIKWSITEAGRAWLAQNA
jgi:hypothetical protein